MRMTWLGICLLFLSSTLMAFGEEPELPIIITISAEQAEGYSDQEDEKAEEEPELELEMELECEEEEEEIEPSDLTLWNLFSAGWEEPFEGRARHGRAPRFHHFTTKQPFLDREARANFFFQDRVAGGAEDEYELELELEIPFNRRVMIDAEPFYTWTDKKDGEPDENGPGLFIAVFLQLIDTQTSAVNAQFGVARFAQSFGVELSEGGALVEEDNADTILDFAVAGFEDLTPWGLERVGVSYHFEYATFIGPSRGDRGKNFFTYGLAVAKTLVPPDVPLLGDFTVFLETFGLSQLDGTNAGRFGLTFLPGIRTNLGTEKSPWFAVAGIQVPVTGPKPFDYTFSFALIHWFE